MTRTRVRPSASRPARASEARASALAGTAVRSLIVVVLALAASSVAPRPAAAHGGSLLGSAVAGPYRTQVTGAPLTEPGKPPAIDITVYVSNATSDAPVTDATVRTTVTAEGRTTRPSVRQIAGGYEAVVPVSDAYTVGQQAIDVRIAGPLGTGRITIQPAAEAGGPPVVAIVASTVILLLLCGVAIRARRRRSGAPLEWQSTADAGEER